MSTLKSDGIQPTLNTNNLIIRSGADVERLRIQPNGQILVASTTGTTFAGEVNFSNTVRLPGGVQVGGGIGPTRYTALDVVHTNTGLGLPDAVNYNTTRSRSNMMIQASGTNTTLFFGNNSSTSSWLQVQNSDNSVYGLALQPVGGNVGIGNASPAYALDVTGTGRFTNNYNSNKLLVSGFGTLLGYGIRTDPANMTDCRPMVFFNTSTTMIGSISHPTDSTTAYNTSSDYRLKENVVPLTGGLSRVNALKPSLFTWKMDGSLGEGFIAHELCDVVPLAVSGEKDQVDENGDMVPQQVDMSKIVPVLVAAIQELKGIVDAQAEEIQQLKAR